MIEIIKELNIEVSKPNVFQAVVAKQYDMNTRFIKATFVDSGNKIYIDPDATVKVVINALRQDGQSKGFEGEVNQDGTVTVPLHSWMLELAGTVSCDISVIDTETDDNKKLTTTGFTLLVEQAAFGGDDITSDPQFDVLVALLEASEVAQEALDKSNEANAKYDACVEATEAANQAANTLTLTHDDIVSGGYIESLKELNVGSKFSFWVGTREQYDAITEKATNCLYLVTDEVTGEDINAVIGELQERLGEDETTITEHGELIGTLWEIVSSHGESIETLSTHDYVVEQNMWDEIVAVPDENITEIVKWNYRKWNSGFAELWGTATATPHTGNGINTVSRSVPFPFGLTELPVISCEVGSYGWNIARPTYVGVGQNNLEISIYPRGDMPNDGASFIIHMQVMGKWK